MNSEHLFKMALGIESPWEITNVQFKGEELTKELHIDIDFKRGALFPDSSGELCAVHDTKTKTWRHLNFFNIPAIYIVEFPESNHKMAKSLK